MERLEAGTVSESGGAKDVLFKDISETLVSMSVRKGTGRPRYRRMKSSLDTMGKQVRSLREAESPGVLSPIRRRIGILWLMTRVTAVKRAAPAKWPKKGALERSAMK